MAAPAVPAASPVLDSIEGVCRFMSRLQDARGAVIDPVIHREHQYSTPYFAYGVGVLRHAGRARDLQEAGIRAMEHATACLAGGPKAIPDAHGEFFLASLAGALGTYESFTPREQWARWRERMRTPLRDVIVGMDEHTNNWRTYAMKGEWLRVRQGLAERDATVRFIEQNWIDQRKRIVKDKLNLYQDHTSDPESHGVDPVGRGNLLALVESGYDGPAAAEITEVVERGGWNSLRLQSPDGQCPPNGRTDDHVFNDVLYQLQFEVLAERAWRRKERERAGMFRRAARLAFESIQRWKRSDGEWAGSFSITKNRFDAALRVGFQPASQVGNYSGAVAIHLAEAYEAHRSEIPEVPCPAETGGYAVEADPSFGSVFLNAGGMQVMANLRGDVKGRYDIDWTVLGIARIAMKGWDARLGPGDGVRVLGTQDGVSFCPSFREGGRWLDVAGLPERYAGKLEVRRVSPDLVDARISYVPREGQSGPVFHQDLSITPTRVTARLRADGAEEFAQLWPVLENDGQALIVEYGESSARTMFRRGGDSQNFSCQQAGAVLDRTVRPLRSTYGWLRPVRVTAQGGEVVTVIEPRRG